MKRYVLAFFCFASLACAKEEPLIPASINVLMPKITAGMTSEEIRAVVVKTYAKSERRDGPWSGQSGDLGFRLDDRFSFTIAALRVGRRARLLP